MSKFNIGDRVVLWFDGEPDGVVTISRVFETPVGPGLIRQYGVAELPDCIFDDDGRFISLKKSLDLIAQKIAVLNECREMIKECYVKI